MLADLTLHSFTIVPRRHFQRQHFTKGRLQEILNGHADQLARHAVGRGDAAVEISDEDTNR